MPQHFTKAHYAFAVGIQMVVAVSVYYKLQRDQQTEGMIHDLKSNSLSLVKSFSQESSADTIGPQPDRTRSFIETSNSGNSMNTTNYYLLSANSLLFNRNFLYSGEWTKRSKKDLFSNDTETDASTVKQKGVALGMFHSGWYDILRFTLNLLDEPYSDTTRIVVSFDLAAAIQKEVNSTLSFSPDYMGYINVERVWNLAFREGNFSKNYTATLRLVDGSTGLPFGMSSPQFGRELAQTAEAETTGSKLEDMRILIDFVCEDLDLSVAVSLDFLPPAARTLREPVVLMGLMVLAMFLIVEGSNKLEEGYDYYFLSNLSYPSLMVLTVIHFQYVGAFILFMVVIDTPFVLFFVFCSIATTFNTVFVFKTCFIVFLYNYIDHPLIDAMSFRSPRVAFTIVSLLSMIGFYVASILLVGFRSYAYYLMALHLAYPLLHVINTIQRKTKQCFSKHLQLCLWWPSTLFAIMLRGYGGNILNLEPSYLMTFSIMTTLIGCTIISYQQSIKGALFMFPESWNIGYKRLLVSVEKIPEDKLAEDCPICYDPLFRNPLAEEGVELVDLNQPDALKTSLLPKNHKLAKGPCSHYFHPSCLISWLEKKPECPICKQAIHV